MIRILKFAIIVLLPIKILLVASSVQNFGVPNFTTLFETLATTYTEMHGNDSSTNVFRQIDTFTVFLFYFALFGGVFWRKRIGKKYVVLLGIEATLDLVYQIFYIGTQRSIITYIIVLMTAFSVKLARSNRRLQKKQRVKIILITVFALYFFFMALSARRTLWNNGSLAYLYRSGYDYDNWLLAIFPTTQMKYGVCNVLSYFCQGWYGLTLAMQMPFEWTYCLGGMRGLNSIVSQLIPAIPSLTDLTYPVRAGIKFNFDGLACWYSIFPWLASDFTWIGALIYMGIVAYLYAHCWVKSVKYDNPLAFVILVLLNIQYIFVVANNQLFVGRGESLATVVLFLMYFLFANRFDHVDEKEEISDKGRPLIYVKFHR